MRLFKNILTIVAKNKIAFIFFITAAFLRLYKFQEFVTFLGDQGRDAIVMKRLITFEHLPAIGPPSSIGSIFLGPFYYYLTAPFLFLSQFNPIGPAFAVAVISILGIVAFYFITKHLVNRETALIGTAFLTFSSANIESSRFAWNPNPLPVFAFITLYLFYKAMNTRMYLYAIACGVFLGLSFQLHHLAGLLLIPMLITYMTKRNLTLSHVGAFVGSFLFVSLPLILFDIKNQFLNTKNLIKLFTEKNIVSDGSLSDRFLDTNATFFSIVFRYDFAPLIAFALFLLLIIVLIKNKFFAHNLFLQTSYLAVISYIFCFSFLSAEHHIHYYNTIYYAFFLILAHLLTTLLKPQRVRILLTIAVLGVYIFLNFQHYSFFKVEGNNQIGIAQTIARALLALHPQEPYQVVAIPYTEMDAHVRYFLEVEGNRPLPEDTIGEPKELYVICHQIECTVLNDAQWQIAAFTDKKIATISAVRDLKIYKLVHGK